MISLAYKTKQHIAIVVFIFLLLRSQLASCQQDTLRALFIGNSYTAVNNLPQLVANLSAAGGKTLIIDSNTPGGYSYGLHSQDATSLSKIRQGNWDVIVLQEQSQIPTIDQYRYNDMYTGAMLLHDSIRLYNPCAVIITYMTWGRRFGGQQCINGYCSPAFTDFSHMQDSLRSAYEEVSDLIGAKVAPVGMAWKKALLEDTSLVLHASDNSHPDITGSYLASCVFYCAIWQTSPIGINYDAGLSPTLAQRFREIADTVYFHDSSDWNISIGQPNAAFSYTSTNDTFYFTNLSSGPDATSFHWDFGDGNTDTTLSPSHVYAANGLYNVVLIAEHCGIRDSQTVTVPWQSSQIQSPSNEPAFRLFPNPAGERLSVSGIGLRIGDRFELTEITGKVLISGFVEAASWQIDLRGISPGMYLLKIGEQKTRLIKK